MVGEKDSTATDRPSSSTSLTGYSGVDTSGRDLIAYAGSAAYVSPIENLVRAMDGYRVYDNQMCEGANCLL